LTRTFQELEAFVENQSAEGLRLEFKSISYVKRGKMKENDITKAVTAFANSVGGSLILGIETKKLDNATRLELEGDDPSEMDKTLALETIIEQKTNPSVENYEVQLLMSPTGAKFYWIEVQRSAAAPHQAGDNLYYKRNGSRSLPMEHFEIEDVRTRLAPVEYPLDVRVQSDNTRMVKLTINNRGSKIIENVNFRISSQLPLHQETVARLNQRPLTRIYPDVEFSYYLGETVQFLQTENGQIEVSLSYEVAGKTTRETRHFDVQDFYLRLLENEQTANRLNDIEKAIIELGSKLGMVAQYLEGIERAFSASGLHLADSTLRTLQDGTINNERKYDFTNMDVEGLRDILGVTKEQASELWRHFSFIGHGQKWSELLNSLPESTRNRIAERFEFPKGRG
jgi:hypothetical protein